MLPLVAFVLPLVAFVLPLFGPLFRYFTVPVFAGRAGRRAYCTQKLPRLRKGHCTGLTLGYSPGYSPGYLAGVLTGVLAGAHGGVQGRRVLGVGRHGVRAVGAAEQLRRDGHVRATDIHLWIYRWSEREIYSTSS